MASRVWLRSLKHLKIWFTICLIYRMISAESQTQVVFQSQMALDKNERGSIVTMTTQFVWSSFFLFFIANNVSTVLRVKFAETPIYWKKTKVGWNQLSWRCELFLHCSSRTSNLVVLNQSLACCNLSYSAMDLFIHWFMPCASSHWHFCTQALVYWKNCWTCFSWIKDYRYMMPNKVNVMINLF